MQTNKQKCRIYCAPFSLYPKFIKSLYDEKPCGSVMFHILLFPDPSVLYHQSIIKHFSLLQRFTKSQYKRNVWVCDVPYSPVSWSIISFSINPLLNIFALLPDLLSLCIEKPISLPCLIVFYSSYHHSTFFFSIYLSLAHEFKMLVLFNYFILKNWPYL